MSLWVKLCGMRTESDVVSAAAAGADAVGFVLTPSPRRIELDQAARLLRRLPDGVHGVAVYHQPTPGLLEEAEARLGPVFHQAEADHLEGIPAARRLPVVVDGPGLEERVAAALVESVGMVLVDSAARGGTGSPADWSRLAGLTARDRVVIAGGLDPRNVARVVSRIRPLGVDVSSGIERRPGEKDPELMRHFVIAARSALERGEALR